MIPEVRLSYRFAFDGEEYGGYIVLQEGATKEMFREAAEELFYSAEDTYELLIYAC